MERPKIICLTPVLNEEWILERFLKCTSLWADHIIIADQRSTDGSQEISRNFPKVTLIDNASEVYNELDRQQMLLAEARRIPGPKLFLALDADEFLTANFLTSPEWETIVRAPPGTVIQFQWPEVFPDASGLSYVRFPHDRPVGFMDNGAVHRGPAIHSLRIPIPPRAPMLIPAEIKLMHYCLHDRDRYESKIRWYQCYEHLESHKRPLDLYRFYHRDLFVSPSVIKPIPREWIQGYEQRGIDMSTVHREGSYRWDREVLRYFEKHGTAKFKRLALWDVDWTKLYHDLYPDEPGKSFPDPRTRVDKFVGKWQQLTQPDFSHYANLSFSRRVFYWFARRALRLLGW
jgi:hypothetical protein